MGLLLSDVIPFLSPSLSPLIRGLSFPPEKDFSLLVFALLLVPLAFCRCPLPSISSRWRSTLLPATTPFPLDRPVFSILLSSLRLLSPGAEVGLIRLPRNYNPSLFELTFSASQAETTFFSTFPFSPDFLSSPSCLSSTLLPSFPFLHGVFFFPKKTGSPGAQYLSSLFSRSRGYKGKEDFPGLQSPQRLSSSFG